MGLQAVFHPPPKASPAKACPSLVCGRRPTLAVMVAMAIAIGANGAESIDPASIDATRLIEQLIDQTRGETSYSEMTMEIKRPSWNRVSKFSVWTRGREDSLIRFTAPVKDAGSGTLKLGERMWTYSPQIRKAIRLPKSLMTQDWAGSDFSYNDLARTDELLNEYTHVVVSATKTADGTEYLIRSTPMEHAAIVWGKEEVLVRSDGVLLEQSFFDQEMALVKRLRTLELDEVNGRVIPKRMRMQKADEPASWTEIRYDTIEFDVELDDRLFTQFALRGSK